MTEIIFKTQSLVQNCFVRGTEKGREVIICEKNKEFTFQDYYNLQIPNLEDFQKFTTAPFEA